MDIKYICHSCEKEHDPRTLIYKCDCGGLLDLKPFSINFSQEDILNHEWSLFRYLKALPFDESDTYWRDITMGEGLTPIAPLDPAYPDVYVKVDYTMPTLSFKDRGAAVLMAKAKELDVGKVIQDSSGNAGNSIAAYAGRAGIPCDIYVPEGTSKRKIKQISAHGAKVHIVKGSREDTADAALRAVERGEGFYASHVYNPLFYQGTKTYAYELYEQFQSDLPETLFIPVGNGTLLLGCYYGFKELLDLGLIDAFPKFIAVQAQGCAPIYKAYKEGLSTVEEVPSQKTLAEGIAIARPMRGSQILEAIKATQGEIILAPENKITEARTYLAHKGFYVEPTTAATFAAFLDYYDQHNLKGKVVLPLCGAGLKKD